MNSAIIIEAAHGFLYGCTGIAMWMILGGLPRPWRSRKRAVQR